MRPRRTTPVTAARKGENVGESFYAAFNVADIAISAGVILLALKLLHEPGKPNQS